MDFLKKAIRRLEATGATFVAVKDGWIFESHDRGIAPIMKLLSEDRDLLRGTCVADKVIGKAAALLLCYAGIQMLYAKTISEHAISVLKEHALPYECGQAVPFIVNRAGDGMCPMEQLVLDITTPDEAYSILKESTGRGEDVSV
jgi:hypothetical protein